MRPAAVPDGSLAAPPRCPEGGATRQARRRSQGNRRPRATRQHCRSPRTPRAQHAGPRRGPRRRRRGRAATGPVRPRAPPTGPIRNRRRFHVKARRPRPRGTGRSTGRRNAGSRPDPVCSGRRRSIRDRTLRRSEHRLNPWPPPSCSRPRTDGSAPVVDPTLLSHSSKVRREDPVGPTGRRSRHRPDPPYWAGADPPGDVDGKATGSRGVRLAVRRGSVPAWPRRHHRRSRPGDRSGRPSVHGPGRRADGPTDPRIRLARRARARPT